jgi:hypothetical protein
VTYYNLDIFASKIYKKSTMHTSEFDSYIIYHEEKPDSHEMVVITCFLEEHTVGYISFYDGNIPRPEILPHGVMKLAFDFKRVGEIVDTIRFEKPLFISVIGDKSVVSTVREPVGEQERFK